jgi:hypothetical protein
VFHGRKKSKTAGQGVCGQEQAGSGRENWAACMQGSRAVSPGVTGFSSKALGYMADYLLPWIASRFGGPREEATPASHSL